jgi:hypothetical protein
MRKFRYIISPVSILIMCFLSTSYGQITNKERDKFTLLTMPYNSRPLTLYKGEFQALAGYKFSVRTLSYNSDGYKILLKDNGTGSVYHYYFIDMKYGLLNFIELAAETNFLRRGIREESQALSATDLSSSERVSVNKLTEVKGMSDILLKATIRTPIYYKWFDFSVTGGIFIPSVEYKPKEPTHTLTNITGADSYTVNYRYNNKNGFGVPVYLISAAVKMGHKKVSGEAFWSFRTPVKEGENIRWDETLVDKNFSYADNSYQFLLSDSYSFDLSVHYQATGWFDIYINGNFQRTTGGWTEYWGEKYRNPETKLILAEPGFELQISPSLKIFQVAGFPLKGKNCDAPFYLFTTLSFSNFPFLR